MDKKLLILVLILVLLIFSGCTEKKNQEMKEYKIEINSGEFDFESESIELEVNSEKELPKTRFEVTGKTKELKCFGYFDLKKGENKLSIKCPDTETENIVFEITPSDGKTKKIAFEIKIALKEKISLKKGFKYQYKVEYYNPYPEDHNTFILDENADFTKGMVYAEMKKKFYFLLFLIDKNSSQFFTSGLRGNCDEAYKSVLSPKLYDQNEFVFIIPFLFNYLESDENFSFSELIMNKHSFIVYFDEQNGSLRSDLNLIKENTWKGWSVFEIDYHIKNKIMKLYVQAKEPNLVLYAKNNTFSHRFQKEIKEEFDKQKYGCFSD
ncbi:MAG: hypothetical protein ABH986_02910 [archaeon]